MFDRVETTILTSMQDLFAVRRIAGVTTHQLLTIYSKINLIH